MLHQDALSEKSKADLILDAAESIVRSKGFNGFSYADIAKSLNVSKPTLHHYFKTKPDLGLALILRFMRYISNYLDQVKDADGSAIDRLRAYNDIYLTSLNENKMCLCGMLAAEYDTLSTEMQDAVREFFSMHVKWLQSVLEEGSNAGELTFRGSPRDQARLILSNMQGGLLVARSQQSLDCLEAIGESIIAGLRAPSMEAV